MLPPSRPIGMAVMARREYIFPNRVASTHKRMAKADSVESIMNTVTVPTSNYDSENPSFQLGARAKKERKHTMQLSVDTLKALGWWYATMIYATM